MRSGWPPEDDGPGWSAARRPLPERAPDPQVAEAQRREFFAQLHRWLRQGHAVHVFCNNDGERQRFQEIRDLDYFESSRGEDLKRLFQQAESLGVPIKRPERKDRLRTEDYRNKLWITRPRPEIDRVGSAWLIRKFIDPDAKFVFANTPSETPEAIPYDIFEVEFSHHGDCCTFETFIERFGIRDRAVHRLAELIHDADLEDDKFHRLEGFGVEQIFKGFAKLGLTDHEILSKGFECFDALYAQFKRS